MQVAFSLARNLIGVLVTVMCLGTPAAASQSEAERVQRLVAQLAAPDVRVRAAAIAALHGVTADAAKAAVPALIAAIHDPEPVIRAQAAEALGHLVPDDPRVPSELGLALDDREAQVRASAAEAAGQLGAAAKSLVPGLERLIEDDDWRVRSGSLESLGRLAPTIDEATSVLIKALKVGDRTIRLGALRALGQPSHRPRAYEALIGAARDADHEIREEVIHSLGLMGPQQADQVIPAIDRALKDPELGVRIHAVRALEAMGSQAVPTLAAALKNDDWLIRWYVARALGEMGGVAAPAVPALRDALMDEKPIVREAVQKAVMLIEQSPTSIAPPAPR